MQFRSSLDTLSYEEASKIISRHKSDFSQPLYTFGSENPEDWELITESFFNYPEIVRPCMNQLDINGDGELDLILSFLGGNEYSFIGIYFRTEQGYKNIFTDNTVFFGRYTNGDLCLRKPACCDAPANQYYRYSLKAKEKLSVEDALSISTWKVRRQIQEDIIFQNDEWEVTKDTLYTYRNQGSEESLGFFLPGAQRRIIYLEEDDQKELFFCEIIGEFTGRWQLIHGHAFMWLTKDKVSPYDN